jgi:hypothetical protein
MDIIKVWYNTLKRIFIIGLFAFFVSGCFMSPSYLTRNYSSVTFESSTELDEGGLPNLGLTENGTALDLSGVGQSMVVYGKELSGWATTDDASSIVSEIVINSDITLYAIWEDKTSYEVGDRGPTGGWIFKVDTSTYFETAKTDIVEKSWTYLNDNYSSGEYSIPTKELLKEMYNELYLANLGNFKSSIYWTNEDNGADLGAIVDFQNGYVKPFYKENECSARSYRTFSL